MHNEFEKEEKYRLYRTVKEILHPTISKKNISNYRIIVDENILPLRVFYPQKVSNIKNAVIYVPGDAKITSSTGKYSEISSNLAKKIDKLVITIDYEDYEDTIFNLYDKVCETISHIYNSLIDAKIKKEDICLMGDSTGSTIILNVMEKLNKAKVDVGKMVLFYPIISGEYFGKTKYKSIELDNEVNHELIKKLKSYYKKKLKTKELTSKEVFPLLNDTKITFPSTLLLVGNADPLVDEVKDYAAQRKLNLSIIDFAHHGFLNTKDKEIIDEYTESLTNFMSLENN